MKKLFITSGRKRNLIRYSENSDLKDAKEISEEEVISLLMKNSYNCSEKAAKNYIKGVKKYSFNGWLTWPL